ncbi:alpha/beta fold hydrolase [Nocardia sp. R7R-8]|uniref:alpha/beta fold hydrolase n=1 Tax=Nocardia sp. R7R-8 TaxID=3459304 RepID=UPI00403DF612
MSALGTPDYHTPAFFGLEDQWLETAPGEVTHYHDAGHGTPVLLLHGSGTGVSAAANWWQTVPALSGALRVIAPDLIGWGATIEPADASFGIREWGRHVLRLLDGLDLDQAWLVGNSLGGWVALQLAIDHPDRVLGVVSMGTGGAPVTTAAIAHHLDPDITTEGLRAAFRNFVVDARLISDDMVAARQVVAEYEVGIGRLGKVMAARERDRHNLPLQADNLGDLAVPVLLLHGLQDKVIPPARTWELVAQIPTADAVLLNKCGHWSMIERPAAFSDTIKSFVAGSWH